MTILLVALLFGCQESEIDTASELPDEQDEAGTARELVYAVKQTTYDAGENPVDVYSVKIYEDDNRTVELARRISEVDEYYFLSLTSVGAGNYLSGEVVINIDGFISNYRDYEPLRADASGGPATEMVTVILDRYVVNDMTHAVNMQIEFPYIPSFTITPQGIDHIKRFVSEVEA